MSRTINSQWNVGFRTDTGMSEVPYHIAKTGVPTKEQFESLEKRISQFLSTEDEKNKLYEIIRSSNYGDRYREYLGPDFYWVRVTSDCF